MARSTGSGRFAGVFPASVFTYLCPTVLLAPLDVGRLSLTAVGGLASSPGLVALYVATW
ncbi:MAG: hypothetical protein V5A44_09625 [Haloarculaceae archaeon]